MLSFTRQVSVPSGDFLFSNETKCLEKLFGELFPSPPGTSYFLINEICRLESEYGFRPLRGLLIF